MKRVNFSDWQEMALKKDIEQIKKKLTSQEPVLFSLCWELILALGSIIVDHLFDTERAPQWVWIAVLVSAVVPAILILGYKVLKWINSIRLVKKGKLDIRDSVDVFDNQISYWVMLSNAYTDMLVEAPEDEKAEREFLYREGCYYNNKSMRALYEMKPNFHKIFSDNPEDVLKRNLVDLERLRNLLSVMNEQQNKLDAAAKKMDGTGIERQRQLNAKNLKRFMDFLEDVDKKYESWDLKWENEPQQSN